MCGSDGNSYPNICGLNCEKQKNPSLIIAYKGPCEENPCGCSKVYRPVFGINRNICTLNCAQNDCSERCICPRLINQLCGSDGQNYANPCFLGIESIEKIGLTPICYGPCEICLRSCRCTRKSQPVCGTNGGTYLNECLLFFARNNNPNLRKYHDGPCRVPRSLY